MARMHESARNALHITHTSASGIIPAGARPPHKCSRDSLTRGPPPKQGSEPGSYALPRWTYQYTRTAPHEGIAKPSNACWCMCRQPAEGATCHKPLTLLHVTHPVQVVTSNPDRHLIETQTCLSSPQPSVLKATHHVRGFHGCHDNHASPLWSRAGRRTRGAAPGGQNASCNSTPPGSSQGVLPPQYGSRLQLQSYP